MTNALNTSPGLPYPFGVTSKGEEVNFAIYARDVLYVSLCLFSDEQPTPLYEIPLDPKINKTGNVWHIKIHQCPAHLAYAYRVTLSDNTSFLLLDPYAKAIASHAKWGELARPNYQPYGKIVPEINFDWQGDQSPNIALKDLIIYEMHVRGFTNDASSGVKHPGTYLGIIEKLPYLKDLGINAIELMPICEFNECDNIFVNPKTHQHLFNYFGYAPINYFSPMNRYASDSTALNTLIEFKTLVRECHRHGIEVILDVVYNHTGESGKDGPTLSFKGLDKYSYYMIDEKGNYLNYSGCGNTINSNHPQVIELIIHSLRYWVTEMHVDGFRFDLASILTRLEDGTPIERAPVVEAISKDPVLANTKLIAEAWDAAGLYQVGSFWPGSTRWGEWNGKYRDIIRRFIKGTPGHKKPFSSALCGSQDIYGNGKAPFCSINFVTAHDGFSLNDLVSYNEKHNLENGEGNRDGFNYNDSWNCGAEGPSHNQKVIDLRERQKRNFLLALMLSQGVPMLLMGDEYNHTRRGNNNTWSQDNPLNWFLWNELDTHQDDFQFFRSLIHFRNQHAILKQDRFLTDQDITWHGLQPMQPEWDTDNGFIAFTLNSNNDTDLYAAFNAFHLPQNITLPSLSEGYCWQWVVNTHKTSPKNYYEENDRPRVETSSFQIRSYSALLLQKSKLSGS